MEAYLLTRTVLRHRQINGPSENLYLNKGMVEKWVRNWSKLGESTSEYNADSNFLSLKWKARLFILLFLFNNYN
jgi:hypothetical protein